MIDTHEHLADEGHRVNVEKDVLSLFLRHYISTDLANAGLSLKKIEELRDPSVNIERRWRDLEPYWRLVQHTAYARALKIAVRDLYHIDRIELETIGEIAGRVKQASRHGLYQDVFQKAGIELAIVNDLDGVYHPNALYDTPLPRPSDPPGLFRKVIQAPPMFDVRAKSQILYMQDLLHCNPVHTLQDWLDMIAEIFARHPEAVGVKLPHAYGTSLAVSKVTYHEAETVFNQILGADYPDESFCHAASQPLKDYLTHFVIREAIRHNLPIQIHTGLLEGSYNNLRNSDPLHLIPLFMEYREARFVLFHTGYPWIREFIALGKMYPNVWLDLCWVWIISPQAGRAVLHEVIETIPQNKVTAFGGDYIFIEGTYGHRVMAQQNIARVLEEKVAEGWFGKDEALQYARAILHDNAVDLYRLPG
jgi:predicted TIM-barrel fold metal-dependent hydrolase